MTQKKNDIGWRVISLIMPLLFAVGAFVISVKVMQKDIELLKSQLEDMKGNPHGVDVEKVVANQIEKFCILYDEKFRINDSIHIDVKTELKEIRKSIDRLKYKVYNGRGRR